MFFGMGTRPEVHWRMRRSKPLSSSWFARRTIDMHGRYVS
jgi:hypothetical protein